MMLALLAEAALRSAALIGMAWLALRLLRVTNPFTQMAVWVGVLALSLAMPLLMHLTPTAPLTVPLDGIRVWLQPATELVTMAEPAARTMLTETGTIPVSIGSADILLGIYWLVAATLLFRLGLGTLLSLRLRARAQRLRTGWTAGRDIRVSHDVTVPLTIAGTILLPPDFSSWSVATRQAVLAHEASHIERRDYYTLFLATLYRALFWFSPAAWWLDNRLAMLAEANSDTAALEQMEDHLTYAEILVAMAAKARRLPAGLAMARPATIAARVERILHGGSLPLRMNARRWALVLALLTPATVISAGATGTDKIDPVVAARMAEQAKPRTAITLAPNAMDKFAGYYEAPFTANHPLKVYREGDHLLAHVIGQKAMTFYPESPTKFFSRDLPLQGSFQVDGQGVVSGIVLHQNGHELPAPRIDESRGKALEQALAERVKSNKPLPGSEAALRAHIAQIKAGKIERDSLVGDKADAVISLLPKIQAAMLPLGDLKSVEFKRVDEGGMDVYRTTYANGVRDWWVLVTPEGKLDSMWFGPAS